MKGLLLEQDSFCEKLSCILDGHKTGFSLKEEKFDIKRFTKQYLIRGNIRRDKKLIIKAILKTDAIIKLIYAKLKNVTVFS